VTQSDVLRQISDASGVIGSKFTSGVLSAVDRVPKNKVGNSRKHRFVSEVLCAANKEAFRLTVAQATQE